MVRLYLLGFTHDLKGVVFGQRRTGKTASFWVPVDDNFIAALDKLERARRDRARSGKRPAKGSRDVLDLDDFPPARKGKPVLPPVGRSQARSGLPASEIQQMLREGKNVKTVAQAARTPLAWVERLAEPVLTERMGVVRLAQRAYMSRARLGVSGLQLGDAVQRNLEERRGTDTIDAIWDARASASGTWRVWVRFSHRGKRRSAEWEFRKGSRQIMPRNRLASQLGWWAPEPAPEAEIPAPADGEAPPAAEEDKTAAPARARAKPRRPTRKRPTARKRQAPRKTSRPTARKTKRAPARKTRKKPSRRKARPTGSRRR